MNKGEAPCDYERQLLHNHLPRLKSILNGDNPPPYELEIQPSATCNAQCQHCWAKTAKKLEDRLTTKEAIERVIDQSIEFTDAGFRIEVIKFCGSTGDPLNNPLTLYAINLISGKRKTRLFTNGIEIAKNINNTEYLSTISKINRLNLSLDAGTSETLHQIKPGSQSIELENILKSVSKIRSISSGMDIEVSYVITNQNYHEIAEAARKIRDYESGNRLKLRIDMVDRSVSELHYDEILNQIERAKDYSSPDFEIVPVHSKKQIKDSEEDHFGSQGLEIGCFTCKFWGCVGSSGEVYPCGHIVSADTPSYGNLFERDFKEIWNSPERMRVISELPSEKCRICSPSSLRNNTFVNWLKQYSTSDISQMYEESKNRNKNDKIRISG